MIIISNNSRKSALAISIDIRAIAAYLTAITLCIVILIWIMQLWKADIGIPFTYYGDALLCESLIKGLVDNGWYLHNSFLGAPDGQYLYDFPVNANLDIAIMKIISVFIPNSVAIINIYFLLTFILTTILTMLVLRHFNVSYSVSILGSLLYSFVPYHFLRGIGHLTLAAYYMIPAIVMVILWASMSSDRLISLVETRSGTKRLNRKSLMMIIICLLISSSFIYYPFFSCFFLLIAGIINSISTHNKYSLLTSFILISLIILGVLANASPSIIYMLENGKNQEVAMRSPIESEIYGLKIAQLLMPINGHRIPWVAIIPNYYNNAAPLVNENQVASLGLIGSMGFLILIIWILYLICSGTNFKKYYMLNNLSVFNLYGLLLATIGGFGTVFAGLALPEIRCYNRISIFIAFFSLFAIVLILDEFSKRYVRSNTSRLLFSAFICLALAAGVFDQTSESFVPPYDSIRSEYLNDEYFIKNIEAVMPENAMIFQLPYVPFPESPPVYKMDDYSHFRAYLHSKDLRWSYGTIKGRQGDRWQRMVANMPVDDMLKALSQAGFEGIYIDTYGFEDGGTKLISEIKEVLATEPLVSDNQRFCFFEMTV